MNKALASKHENADDSAKQPFSIDQILDNSKTDFDLFIQVGDEYILYAAKDYLWEREELTRLLNQGYHQLYYCTSDAHRVHSYQALNSISDVLSLGEDGQPVSPEDFAKAAGDLNRILFTHEITPALVHGVNHVGKQMIKSIEEDLSCVKVLSSLAKHDDYTYFHSGRVAGYSIAIALKLGLTDEQTLCNIALGCLLHDIGKSKINPNILNKKGPLSESEWEEMKRHPEFGIQEVHETNISEVCRSIILSHHEKLDGSGYPNNLPAKNILPEVRIATVADIYDALTSNRVYHISRNSYDALNLMKEKMEPKLDKDVYHALIDVLK